MLENKVDNETTHRLRCKKHPSNWYKKNLLKNDIETTPFKMILAGGHGVNPINLFQLRYGKRCKNMIVISSLHPQKVSI